MPRGRSDKSGAALKVLWENRGAIGSSLYTYEATRVIVKSMLFGITGAPLVIRRLEKKGFFNVCDVSHGQGMMLEIKWSDAGINHFGGEKPKLVSLPANLTAGLAKDSLKKSAKKVLAPKAKKPAPETAKAYAPIASKPGPAPARIGVILIDWDNIAISAAEEDKMAAAGSELNNRLFRAIIDRSLKFVDKADIFIYTAEGHLDRNPLLLLDAEEDWHVELIVVPSEKDAADAAMVKKAEEIVASSPDISRFIFVSGDGYFIPLTEKLLRAKKQVLLLPWSLASMNFGYEALSNLKINFLL